MNIAILGLGYVGCVSAACFVREGHDVIGVDIAPHKVALIRQGQSPIIEPGLAELIQTGVTQGKLQATTDTEWAVAEAEILMICVGTPSLKNGRLNLEYVENVCRRIGRALRQKTAYTVVVIRSTMLPGAAEEMVSILEAESGKQVGTDFGFCVNPEFLREGSAIKDFDQPPYTVIGEADERSGATVAALYEQLDAPIYRVALGAAEMVKYASNAFHALKVAFANEIGNLSQAYGVDSHVVMDIFAQDNKLNLSKAYLKPGFAFGGSCLPKDVRAALYGARQADVETPVLASILPSNALQVQKAVDIVLQEECRRVGLLGLSFKPLTDDLRESPAIELAERLIGKGFELFIYDHEVALSRLHGSNRAYIDKVIPHLASLMQPTLPDMVTQSEVIVVAKQPSAAEQTQLYSLLTPEHVVVDLVRLNGRSMPNFKGRYHGICW